MYEQISSMNESVIRECHPWMEEPHPWMKVSSLDVVHGHPWIASVDKEDR